MKKFNLKESSEETIKQAVRNFYSKKSKEDLLNEIFTILDMFLKDKGLSYDDVARGLKSQGHDIDVEDPVQAARKELPKLGVQLENLNEGKKPKGYMAELAEIDAQSAIVAMEAKINKLEEMALAKEQRLNMVSEDENLSELISKSAVKEMQKEIKEIRKMQEKLKKVYEKKNGKKMPEMVDEDEEINEYGTSPQMIPDKKEDGTYDIKEDELEENNIDPGAEPKSFLKKKPDYTMEEEIEEGGYMPNYEEDSDGTMEEEVNEEVERFKKLAGI